MYSQALEAIIFVGNLRIALIAIGWVTGIGCVIAILVGLIGEDWRTYFKRNIKLMRRLTITFGILMMCICIACIAVYNMPMLREDIIIARQVAPILDDYMERHPESIYHPDVMLTAVDSTIKGIVGTAIELPKYIQRLAAGLPLIERRPEDMSQAELVREINRLRSKN